MAAGDGTSRSPNLHEPIPLALHVRHVARDGDTGVQEGEGMKVQVKVNGRLGPILEVPDDIKAEDITIEVIEGSQTHEVNLSWLEFSAEDFPEKFVSASSSKDKPHA